MTTEDDMISLAQRRTRRFVPGKLILTTTPNGPQRGLMGLMTGPATAKVWYHYQVKTCLQCGARVAVDPAGNIPEGGMPCGH